jgi:hypothetical protein
MHLQTRHGVRKEASRGRSWRAAADRGGAVREDTGGEERVALEQVVMCAVETRSQLIRREQLLLVPRRVLLQVIVSLVASNFHATDPP